MKSLLFGILFIIVIGIGGLVYRNAVEHPTRPIACPLDALVCPDGTSVARTGLSCTFPACPPPNVTLPEMGISYALPTGFVDVAPADRDLATITPFNRPPTLIYILQPTSASSTDASIEIYQYSIAASSTALATIQQTAIGSASGAPVNPTSFSSTVLGTHRFTVVSIGRFEGVVDTAYYLARGSDVIRFDAIDRGVARWTDANLDLSVLPAHAALVQLLSTLQGS